MSFVDVTGTVDADTDGIVFEGKPGLERPIIPRFIVPKNLARRISSLTEGDALEIEKQRRSGNSTISFDENKLRSIIADIGGDVDSIKPVDEVGRAGMRSMRMSDEPDNPDMWGNPPDEPPYIEEPEQYDAWWTPEYDQLRDLDIRSGRTPQDETPPVIEDKYKIVKSNDGVFYAEGITSDDVYWLRSGYSKPPKLPFFAPIGGGDDQNTGEGYYFSTNGKRYWGKYGASGALVRRRNKDGEYEYFLARRSNALSTGGGRWAFPGGAHKDKESASIPGFTAAEEFGEEVGGDISSLKPVSVYKDQVAPDWSYDTYVYEVGENQLNDLVPETDETSEVGWFTANEIKKLAQDGEVLDSFGRSMDQIFKQSGDESVSSDGMGSSLDEINTDALESWRQKLSNGDEISPNKYSAINRQIEQDSGVSIGQLLQEEYDDGASIQEIAENWGLDVKRVQELLESPRGGMSSAKRNMQAPGRDASPSNNRTEKVLDFIVENMSPLGVIIAIDGALERRKAKRDPKFAEKLRRENLRIEKRFTRLGKSGMSVAEKMALPEYVSLMEKVRSPRGSNTVATSGWTKEVQSLLDAFAKKVDGDFLGLSFEKSNFQNIDFRDYDLSFASFLGSKLDGAKFSECIIDSATFEDASLIGASFANCRRAWRLDFSGADLTRADMTNTNMNNTLFNETKLVGTKFNGANMRMVKFNDVDLTQVDGMQNVSLHESDLRKYDLSGINFQNASLVGCDFRGANFTNANLNGADLRAAKIDKANFTGASLDGVELKRPGLAPQSSEGAIFDTEINKSSDAPDMKPGRPDKKAKTPSVAGMESRRAEVGQSNATTDTPDVSSLSDDEINAAIEDNVSKLKELDTLLDDGDIDLAEFRKRQTPLRKQSTLLGKEKNRRTGKTPSPQQGDTAGAQRPKTAINRGTGMIERDERGNPEKWDGKKFLQEQAEKRRKFILDLGFTEQEADVLLGQESSQRTRTGGVYSSRGPSTKPTFTLEPSALFVKKLTVRNRGPVEELAGWSDREINNALEMYDIRAPREWDVQSGSYIPSWFPSKESLIRELDSRGYDVFLGTGSSRRFNDLVHMPSSKEKATPEEMRRRIWAPSGMLNNLIADKEAETGQVFPMKSRIQRWDFGAIFANMSDAEIRAIDIGFDNARAEKLADVRSGLLSKEEFNKWFEKELTPLRRVLSAELTHRRLRAAIDGKQTIDSVFGTGISPKEYAFLSKDPVLFTRAAGMLSRRGGPSPIDQMVENGELTEDDLKFMSLYWDTKDKLENQLIDRLTELFGQNPDDVDWDSLDPSVKQKARKINDDFMRRYSQVLARLGQDNDHTADELENMGFTRGEIDDLLANRRSGMESRNKKRKMRQKWTDEDKRAFSEQRLRSKKIPKKRKQGPSSNEWSERRAGREVKSNTRVSSNDSRSGRMASYYDSLANQYFAGLAEYIGEDTRIVNPQYNENVPALGQPFSTIRTSPISVLREGDMLPDGFDDSDMWAIPSNPRYKIVYMSKDMDGEKVLGLRDIQNGELVVRRMRTDGIVPNAMRPSSNKRSMGMASSRKVNDVKLHSKLTQQFNSEQFDDISRDFDGLLSELDSIDSQIRLLERNMDRRRELGITDDGFHEGDDQRWSQLEDMRSAVEDRIGEYVKFAEFVAEENLQRRRHKMAVQIAKQRLLAEIEKRESSKKPGIFDMPDRLASTLFESGASLEDVKSIIDELDISDQEMERVFVSGRPPFTGTKLAKQLTETIRKAQSSVSAPEFDEFDKDDEDEQEIVDGIVYKLIMSASLDAARNKKVADPRKTVIETTATEVPVARMELSAGMSSAKTPMGEGLGVSRVIFPTKTNKFISKDVSFISYDANRQELSVGYKNGERFVFGGITSGMANDVENGEKTLIASINAIKKDARYVVNPDGTSIGKVPDVSDLLKRDISRLNLSGDDLEIAESVVDGLRNGQDDMTKKMRSDRRLQAMELATGLAEKNEYAMAFNIMDALEDMDVSTKGSGYMPHGMRSYSATQHQRTFVGMSQDEIGEIRDEIAAIRKKYRNNFFINHGLSKYDANLEAAQGKNARAQLVFLETEYNSIMDSYEELAKIDPDWAFVIGPHPLEMAGVSKDGRFDTEKFKQAGDFAGKLINNGAPQDIPVSEQKELINWARRQPGFRIVQSIVSSHDEKNGTLTANQWRTLRSLHRNFGKNQYRAGTESRRGRTGMLSMSDEDSLAPDSINANPMGQFVPFGPSQGDQRSREIIPNADLKGKSIQEAIPDGLSNEEQLALLEEVGQYNPKTNPTGIRGKDFVEKKTALLDAISSQRRLEERKIALERAKQSGQIGDDVNLPQHLEFWPLVSDDTKSKLNKAAERKYGVLFTELEPHQMEDVLVFETGASGYYSGGVFKKIQKRPDAIEMEDWERLLLPIHKRVGEIDAETEAAKDAQKLELDTEPSLEQMLEDPNISPERKSRIERILSLKKESAAKWEANSNSARSTRNTSGAKGIKLREYKSIDEIDAAGVQNVRNIAKSKYGKDFDSLTDVQQQEVLDLYAREKFGVEHYRNIETNVQRFRSRAERLFQQDKVDGDHIAAWDEIADVLEATDGPTITKEKLNKLREAIDAYPIESETSTDAEMSLIGRIDELSSLLDDVESSFDEEGIDIPTGRRSGMESRSSFTPSGTEIKPRTDNSDNRQDAPTGQPRRGMSSIFNRGGKGGERATTEDSGKKAEEPRKKKIIATDTWRKVGGQGGSNPGGLFEDENGVRYYVKTPPSQSHIESEVLAAELYKLLGIGVPEISAGTYKGRPNVISKIIDEPARAVTGARGDGSKDWQRKVTDGFIADAWLANWDAILNDNVRMDKNGNPIRVDNGGSMKWRAQGGAKGAAWGDTVGELSSLRGQSPAAPVYRTVTPEQIKQQVANLQSVTPERIRALVSSIISDPAEAKELSDRLIKRRQNIIDTYAQKGGMLSARKFNTPEFGSKQFIDNLPKIVSESSNEELMQMWDMTRPFVNINQYTMNENARNLDLRIEKIKNEIRDRIKTEVALRMPSGTTRREELQNAARTNRGAAELERVRRAEALSQTLLNRSDSIKKSYSSAKMQEDEHTSVWDKVLDTLNNDGKTDLTRKKLDDMVEVLDSYINNNNKNIKKQEQLKNIRQAEKMRDVISEMSRTYANDAYIPNGNNDRTTPAGRTVGRVPRTSGNDATPEMPDNRAGRAPTRTTAQYMSARKNQLRSQGMLSATREKEGRAEIRGEATFFKSIQDMLLHEAGKSEDSEIASALRSLNIIMDRQKSGLISDRRTNAGAIYLTQKETDKILDALYAAIGRQVQRGNNDRAKLLSDFADKIAMAAIATFIERSVPEVNSRTVTKINSEGREVEIPLNE